MLPVTDGESQPSEELLTRMGRFDQSFFVRMIVGFLLLTILVALVEVGLRYAAVLWDFHRVDQETPELAARELAEDIRTIMMNHGGPVASRTVYPILERNFRRAGLRIAVEPSEGTRTAIERMYGFVPEGIPSDWPEGTFNEGALEVRADQVCLTCHVDSEVGSVLGTVTVREYLDHRLEGWWEDLRLTATLNLAKAGVHTIILFLLLRALMTPLLSLRSAVSRLGKGTSGLRIRARVVSADEFGELAHDLNAFLDRINGLMEELRRTTARSVALSQRLTCTSREARLQLARVEDTLNKALPADEEAWAEAGPWARGLPQVLKELHELRHHVQGIEYLEERLEDVADDGRRLLDRLLQTGEERKTE
jgi:HAMP domain-containing protein